MSRADDGFTLLEILAALAIAAVAFAAVAKTTGSAVAVLQATEDRMLGTWVASNRLAELRIAREFPAAATHDRSAVLGGRTWYYREAISTTGDPDLLRIDISVFTDSEHTRFSASLFGYLARYAPPQVIEAAPVGPGQ